MEDHQMEEKLHFEHRIDLSKLTTTMEKIKAELGKVIVGQEKMIDLLLVAILSNGHALIEGVPGVAKTITAKILAKTIQAGFGRIQFTPDLMPSDILGTSVYNLKTNEFELKKGPIFSNIILIDEINRAPAKTQAALFEVMEERQITIDGTTHPLKNPFLVLATQNPIEQEGTYRLPEAQLDRFLFKISVDYPSLSEEIELINREHRLTVADKTHVINSFLKAEDIIDFQKTIKSIIVEPLIIEYIAKVIHATRINPYLYLGASPRASLALLNTSKALAALRGRDFVTPDDIKTLSLPVLEHRLMITPEKEMEGMNTAQIVAQILDTIEIPR